MPSLPKHDPLNVTVSREELRSTWKAIMQFPTAATDGLVFDFDRDSRELMEGAIRALTATGLTINWRLFDNSEIPVDAAALQNYFNDLLTQQAIRGLTVDSEYTAFKAILPTRREVENWKKSHMPA